MPLHIKEPRRKFYLVICDIINELGGPRAVAGLCGVAPVSPSKWKDDPDGSGQDIPVRHLQTILAESGKRLTNYALQNLVDELVLDHFLRLCHRRAYLEDKVHNFIEMLQGQTNGRVVNE